MGRRLPVMTDIFISYARSTAAQARQVADALLEMGYAVWRDDELPAHRPYAEVIEERLAAAKAVVVIWSAEAAKSQWVFSEANRAREDGKLIQLSLDGTRLPMPFDTIQCADMAGWSGDVRAAEWLKVAASVGALMGGPETPSGQAPATALPALPSKPSIAVMPFANLSADPDQDYFADGMVEEIVGALSRFTSIFVIASGSTLTFKGKAVSPQEAARILGVRYVLNGSVRKSGERVRITVNLIDTTLGAQIWSERFDDTLEDIFALQDKVALSAAGVIEPAIRVAETARVANRPTENMGSYDLALRARQLVLAFRKPEVLAAVDLFERAVTLDPDYAPAFAHLANALTLLLDNHWTEDIEGTRRRGLEAAERALQIGPQSAETLAMVANALSILDPDLGRATALSERALALNPGLALSWFIGGLIRLREGDSEVAIERFETAIRLDPISTMRASSLFWVAFARLQQGRFEEVVSTLQETAHPVLSRHLVLASAFGHLGRTGEARAALAIHTGQSVMPAETLTDSLFRRPEHRMIYLDGLALAEARSPVTAP